jgi:hypothetical protein
VELRAINGEIVVAPLGQQEKAPSVEPYDPADPVWQFGKNPVDTGLTDGAANHDQYLYGDPHRLDG